MAKVQFKRYETDAEAQASNIVDGQLIVTKDGTAYADYNDERVPIGGSSSGALTIDEKNININANIKIQRYDSNLNLYLDIKDAFTSEIALKFYKNGAMVNCVTDIQISVNDGNETVIETYENTTYIRLSREDTTAIGEQGRIILYADLSNLSNYIPISWQYGNNIAFSSDFYSIKLYQQSIGMYSIVRPNGTPISQGQGSVTYMARNTRID